MKSCIFICYDYPPISSPGAQRVSRLVPRLERLGWCAHVATVHDGYSSRIGGLEDPLSAASERVTRASDPLAWVLARLGTANPATQPRQRVQSGNLKRLLGLIAKPIAQALVFPDRGILWAFNIARRIRAWRHKDIALVHSTQPNLSNHFVGFVTARRLGVPWVAEFRDPLSWAPKSTSDSAWKRRFLSWLEGCVVRHADATVVVASTAEDYFRSRYPGAKIVSIPNGAIFDIDEVRRRMRARRLAVPKKYLLVHAGSLYGGARNPEPLIRAVKEASKQLSLPVELRFYGNDSQLAADIAASLGCAEFIKATESVPFDECLAAINQADINIALLHDDPVARVSIMSKYFDYLPSGAPILLMGDPEALLSRMVKEDASGASFAYSDVHQTAEWIVKALEGNESVLPESDRICLKWSADAMAKSMADLFDELSAKR